MRWRKSVSNERCRMSGLYRKSLITMARNLKFASLNVRGLKDEKKRNAIFYWLRKQNFDVILLQETHCHCRKEEYCWGKEWDGQSVWGWGTNRSKGVAILFSRKHRYEYDIVERDMNGRIIALDLKYENNIIRIINIYAPNNPLERESFFQFTVSNILSHTCENIIGGDYNCTLNPHLDRGKCDENIKHNDYLKRNEIWSHPIVQDRGAKVLENMMTTNDLEDVWRRRNPESKSYTWQHYGKNAASRIDIWMISKSLDPNVKQVEIINNVFSDHHLITLEIKFSDTERGKGYWKMNHQVIKSTLFRDCFSNFWKQWQQSRHDYTDLKQWWDLTKVKIKQLTIWCSIQLNKERLDHIRKLENRLRTETNVDVKKEI